jgi:antitoxin ParD1/3/4
LIIATVRKTITLTDKQDHWIKSQIKNGGFTNESEYIRDLVDQNRNAEFLTTKAAILNGFRSGVSEMDIPEIMKEVEEKDAKGWPIIDCLMPQTLILPVSINLALRPSATTKLSLFNGTS